MLFVVGVRPPTGAALKRRRHDQWADTVPLTGDLATAVRELKAQPGGELQVHGSGTLVRWLLEQDLVDELQLLVVPVGEEPCALPEDDG